MGKEPAFQLKRDEIERGGAGGKKESSPSQSVGKRGRPLSTNLQTPALRGKKEGSKRKTT